MATLLNVCAWITSASPQQAQDDVWGGDPDALVCGVLAPTAETRKVEGEHTVSGRWYYNSGSWHATWAIVGIPLTDESGGVVDQALALIPRRELEYEETWFIASMRSKYTVATCVIAKDVFVPDHRIVSVPQAIEGHYATEHTDEALYQSAFVPILALVLAGPRLRSRAGRHYEIVREKAAKKPISYTFYTPQADSVAFQLQLAEAAMLIDTAHLHAYRAAADIDEAAARGGFSDFLTRARVQAGARLGHRSHRAGHRHPVVGSWCRQFRRRQPAPAPTGVTRRSPPPTRSSCLWSGMRCTARRCWDVRVRARALV